MSALIWVAVGVLGGASVLARFVVDGEISKGVGRAFPFGVLVVNVSGSLLLGLIDGLGLAGTELTFVGMATLGSYTTFSTWMFETNRLAEDGFAERAWLNIAASIALGFVAVFVGRALGRLF